MAEDHSRQPPAQAPTCRLAITVAIEADYRNRGVFPGLRADSADRRDGRTLYFTVPVEFARAVLEDAEARRAERTNRWIASAYTGLLRHLRWKFERLDATDEADDDAAAPATQKEQKLLEVYGRMPASFKPVAVMAVEQMGKAQSDAEKTCWLNVWRACCAASNRSTPQAAPPRGHLRLAWSAPEAPAWTSDL